MQTNFNPYQHFGFLTNRIARLINQEVEPLMVNDGYQFPISCMGILADLWAKDGISQKDLASSLIKNKSSINLMLEALIEDDLIIKKSDISDRRSKRIFLTAKGKNLQHIIEKRSATIESKFLTNISRSEIETAKKVLSVLYESLVNKNPHLEENNYHNE